MKYIHTPDMGEISGFGDDYEAACQKMLNAGVKWILENPQAILRYKGFEDVYGLMLSDTEDSKTLDKVLAKAVGRDAPTGAMHHAIVNRLLYIKQHGWEEYCEELRKIERG